MSILRVSISRFKAIISKCEILLHGRSENLHFLHCVVSSSSSGDKQQIDIKYKISPACLAKYKIYRDCGWGQRERAIYRVCTAPVSSPPPRTTATCCGKVSRAADYRGAGHGGTQVVLRWYSRWYSRWYTGWTMWGCGVPAAEHGEHGQPVAHRKYDHQLCGHQSVAP